MPIDRENGEIFTPPLPKPEQQVPARVPQPRPAPVNSGLPRMPAGMGMPQRAVPREQQNYVQPEHAGEYSMDPDTQEGARGSRHIGRKIGGILVAVTIVGGIGVAGYDGLTNDGKGINKVLTTVFHTKTGPSPTETSHPSALATTTPEEEATTLPTPTITTPKPTPSATPTKLAIPTTTEACAKVTPLDIKIGQLVEPAIDANSNMAEIKAISLKYHIGSWLVLKYPVKSDGKTPDVESILETKNTHKDMPALITIDGEAGTINRLQGATVPMGPDKISATQPAPATLQAQLEVYYKQLKQAGVDVNLAPVADVNTTKVTADGRLFRTAADEAKYFPVFNAAAKKTGINLTYKHWPVVLPYGNTDLKPVTTPSYQALSKTGVLNGYKFVKGTTNWVMVGGALTPGYPNTKLDNGKIAVFNPAAYDAARQLAGDPLFITDALNAKAVNAVLPQAEAAAQAINSGADIAMIVPRAGFSTTDTRATIAAIEKGVSVPRIDEAFLKVLAAKSINACTVLPIYNAAYAPVKVAAPKPGPTATTTKPSTSAPKPSVATAAPTK